MNAITLVFRTPSFRIFFLTLACLGAFNASVYPYQSLIAIKHIGLTPSDFALILMIASFVNVAAAVLLGVLADQKANRRMTALFCAAAGAIGMGLMILVPGPVAIVLTAAILLPLSQPLYGQIFAVTRLASQSHEAQADGIQSVIRVAMSTAFVVMLLFWAYAFQAGFSEIRVYLTGALASLGAIALIVIAWPRDGATEWQDRPSGLNLGEAVRQIGRPHIALRFFCLGAVNAAGGIYMATISLVFDASALRGASDVALYVGMVAAWEIPFMLLLPRIIARFSRADLIGFGAAVYVIHLMALHILADTPLLWIMPVFAGLGGTALLILPISYYQSLMEGRPGAASSLMSVQKLVSDALVALCFAFGMAFGGLTAVAVMGTGVSLAGALLLVLADRGALADAARLGMSGLALLWRDPVLRLAVGLMILNGTLWASFGPFVALLAVETFALGDSGYAAVLAISTLVGVMASVWIGITADQRASRRSMAIGTCALAFAGLAMMVIAQGQITFLIFHILLFPVASTIFGQIFTLARLAASAYPEQDRNTITAGVRAAISLPFVLVLPLWSIALGRGVPLTGVYPMALVFSGVMLAVVWRYWPQDARAGWSDAPSGLSVWCALKELANPGLALRLGALGAVAAMPALYVMTLALILTKDGGRAESDPGLFFGLVAGAEVPAMLLMAYVGRHVERLPLILFGAGLSTVFLLALPLLAGSAWVWILILPLALAHGVLLPVPITYLQDMLANRPGTGTSLLALQGLIGNILAAAAFALGTVISGYPLAMVFGGVIGLGGAVTLFWLDRIRN